MTPPHPATVQNGGYARGYQQLSAPRAIPTAATQAAAGPVFMHRQRWP
jgi:hypothetical protein